MGFFQSHSFQQNVLLAEGREDLQLVPLTEGTFLLVLRSRLPNTFIFTLPTERIKINQVPSYPAQTQPSICFPPACNQLDEGAFHAFVFIHSRATCFPPDFEDMTLDT